jgi:THO complex subunit 4
VTKTGVSGTRGRGGAARGRRGGRNPRPAKKTTEELDSEMADYFNGGNNATEGAAPAATGAANGDAAMDDGILV